MSKKSDKDNDKLIMNLYKSAEAYVKSIGGSIVVAGPVSIQLWGEGPHKYVLAISCLGKIPENKNENNPAK